jgi:hypothetical protein
MPYKVPTVEEYQDAILAILKANPDGAWWTKQLCQQVCQQDVTTRQRHAFEYALRQMELPPFWRQVKRNHHYLYNAASVESTLRFYFLAEWRFSEGRDFEQWKRDHPEYVDRVRKRVEDTIQTGDHVRGRLFAPSDGTEP